MKLFITMACGVGSNYMSPSRGGFCGDILMISYKSSLDDTRRNLLEEALVFVLELIGDLSTIKRIPLLNILFSG